MQKVYQAINFFIKQALNILPFTAIKILYSLASNFFLVVRKQSHLFIFTFYLIFYFSKITLTLLEKQGPSA